MSLVMNIIGVLIIKNTFLSLNPEALWFFIVTIKNLLKSQEIQVLKRWNARLSQSIASWALAKVLLRFKMAAPSCHVRIPGGYSLEFLVGVCRPHLQIQTQFQTKKYHFPHPFSDLASKIHTRFHTWPCTWLSIIASVLNGIQRNKDE